LCISLFLFYKPLILNSLFEVFAEESSKQVGGVVNKTKSAIQSYRVGLLLEALIIAIPYSIRFRSIIPIITVLLGAALWDVPGMFLSIPFVGILKIVFDRIPDLKPWGKLLGDTVPTHHKGEL
jgi:predicted PurR-regulated permease PerM